MTAWLHVARVIDGLALAVGNVVSLVDAFVRLRVTDPFEAGLSGDVCRKIAAGASALVGRRLGVVDDVTVVMFASGFGAVIFH